MFNPHHFGRFVLRAEASHRASRQSGDRTAKASGLVLIGQFAYCVLLSTLAAAFAAAFATAPYWIPEIASAWWAP